MFLRKPLVCTISLQPRLCSAFLVSSFCAFPITNRGTCVFIQSLRGKQSTGSWVIYTRSSRRNGSIVSFAAVYRDVTLPPKRDGPGVAWHTERRLGIWAYRADGFWNLERRSCGSFFSFFLYFSSTRTKVQDSGRKKWISVKKNLGRTFTLSLHAVEIWYKFPSR